MIEKRKVMKYIRQFGIILLISFIGEVLNQIIPLPIPASIYGLIIMFTALQTKILPLDKVKETGKFLIEIMPLMFIPAAVGLTESWSILRSIVVPIGIITVVSTILVMGSAGSVTQSIIRRSQKNNQIETSEKLEEKIS